MTGGGCLLYLFAPQVIGLLSTDPAIRALGTQILRIEAFAEAGCREAGMRCAFELRDVFPDTTNDGAAVDRALERFGAAGLPVVALDEPMRWSEDCGWLLKAVPGMFFVIGAGEEAPGLHTEGYAFDDALIAPAVRAFEALL